MTTPEPMPASRPNPSADAPTRPEMPAITDRQLLEDLSRAVKAGFAAQANQILELQERVIRGEQKTEDLADHVRRNSERARGPSQHDLQAQSAIAAEVVERKALANTVGEIHTKVTSLAEQVTTVSLKADGIDVIKKTVTNWWSTPGAQKARSLLWALAWAWWMARHGGH